MITDDYFECKSCKRVAAIPKETEDRTHCPLCGSDKGRVVPAAIARRLFEIGAFTPVDSGAHPKTTKPTRRN